MNSTLGSVVPLAMFFINRRFGSLFWLLGVLIECLFHKKMGPYLKAWGSSLVLEAVTLVLKTRRKKINKKSILANLSEIAKRC